MGTVRRELGDWCSGGREVERFEAPVELPGWSERPWVEVRALTEAEALERESLGLIEEYEVVAHGLGEPELRVRRVYDLVAMAEYEWGKCLVDWCLPETAAYPLRPQTVASPSLNREGEDGETLTPGPSPTGRGGNNNGGDSPGSEVPGWERASVPPAPELRWTSRDAGDSAWRLLARRMTPDDPGANREFLRGMGPCLGAWVRDVLERVNRRLPEQRAEVEVAKKNCGS
jgi:hypothetical protein